MRQRWGEDSLRLPEQSKQIEVEPEPVRQPPVLRAVATVGRENKIKPRRAFELPLDPDIIASYLAGENLAIEPPESRSPPAPPRPTLALIAACVALVIFLISIWIALR